MHAKICQGLDSLDANSDGAHPPTFAHAPSSTQPAHNMTLRGTHTEHIEQWMRRGVWIGAWVCVRVWIRVLLFALRVGSPSSQPTRQQTSCQLKGNARATSCQLKG